MHWHVIVEETETGKRVKRVGALATTNDAARTEEGIEETVKGRSAKIETCYKPCFAGHN